MLNEFKLHNVEFSYADGREDYGNYIDDDERSFQAIEDAMDTHAKEFIQHLIDQGKIKIHFRGDTPESLYKQFNEGKENNP